MSYKELKEVAEWVSYLFREEIISDGTTSDSKLADDTGCRILVSRHFLNVKTTKKGEDDYELGEKGKKILAFANAFKELTMELVPHDREAISEVNLMYLLCRCYAGGGGVSEKTLRHPSFVKAYRNFLQKIENGQYSFDFEFLVKKYENLPVIKELEKAGLKPKIIEAAYSPHPTHDGKVGLSISLEGTKLTVETSHSGTWQLCRRTGVYDNLYGEFKVPLKPGEVPEYEKVSNAMKNTVYITTEDFITKLKERRKI